MKASRRGAGAGKRESCRYPPRRSIPRPSQRAARATTVAAARTAPRSRGLPPLSAAKARTAR
eukprot:4265859-Prymnesium_polylepis.1